DDVLDEAIRRALERHVGALHDIQPALIFLAELRGRLQGFGIEVDLPGLRIGGGAFARIDDAHGMSPSGTSLSGMSPSSRSGSARRRFAAGRMAAPRDH